MPCRPAASVNAPAEGIIKRRGWPLSEKPAGRSRKPDPGICPDSYSLRPDSTRRPPPSRGIASGGANALHRSDSALGAFLRRKKAHLGAPKAITATAHKLARLSYTMLRYGQEYVDAGAEYYERQYQQRALRAAKRRAAQLGYQLVPMSDAGDRTTYAPPGAPTAA